VDVVVAQPDPPAGLPDLDEEQSGLPQHFHMMGKRGFRHRIAEFVPTFGALGCEPADDVQAGGVGEGTQYLLQLQVLPGRMKDLAQEVPPGISAVIHYR